MANYIEIIFPTSTEEVRTVVERGVLVGVKGEKGDIGAQGPQGTVGPQGATGPQGLQGVKGDTGDTGSQGPQGLTGPQGIQGIQGIPGDDGREVELQKNTTHVQWRYVGDITWNDLVPLTDITGPQGATGSQGPQGIQGLKGDQGNQGPQGATGATGAAGPNQVTTSTDTNLSGLLYGNGSKVKAASILEAQQGTIPYVTSTQRDAISSPYVGYLIFNTTEGYYEYFDGFWGWMPVSITNEWRRKWGYEYWNDFGQNNGMTDGVFQAFPGNGGAAAITTNPIGLDGSRVGLMGLRTGTASNGRAAIMNDPQVGVYIRAGSGKLVFETSVFMRTLSTSSDRYHCYFGVGTNIVGGAQTSGCVFLYDEGGVSTGSSASANWQIQTAASNSRTYFSTSVAVQASTWYNFQIEIDETASSVKYYINNTLVRTETTNIPSTAANLIGLMSIVKNVGTTDVGIILDYVGIKKKFNTAR